MDEYLTVAEVAARLKLTPKRCGIACTTGRGAKASTGFPACISPRFRWSAVVRWLEGEDSTARNETDGAAYGRDIPRPARGRRRYIDHSVQARL